MNKDKRVVIKGSPKLTQELIEEAATWAAINRLTLIQIKVSKEALREYNTYAFGKERIVLASSGGYQPLPGSVHLTTHNGPEGEIILVLQDENVPESGAI